MDAEEKIKRLEAMLDDPEQASDPLTYFLLGREYMEAKRFEEGAKSFEKCIELNPQYSAAYRFLGDCYRLSDQKDKAKDIYQTGMTIANESGDLQVVKEIQVFLKKLEN